MNIFLTGASGYIGFAVARHLRQRGHHVIGLVRTEAAAVRLQQIGAVVQAGSLDQLEILRANAAKTDAVIHLAASRGEAANTLEQNAVAAMIDTAATFVYTSGSTVYGDTGTRFASETDSTVSNSRTALEQQVLSANTLRSIVLRPALVYGHQGGIIPRFIKHALETGMAHQIEDGDSRWSTIHVDDLATLYAAALEQASSGTIFNAAAASIRLGDVAQTISKVYQTDMGRWTVGEAAAIIGPIAGVLTWNVQLSSIKAQNVLEWLPKSPPLLEDIAVHA